MKVQTLISAINVSDDKIFEKMNIQTDAILINQTNHFSEKTMFFRGNKIRILSFDEIGVGLSRNNALIRAEADIIVFADQDLTYVDGYKEIILKAFEENLQADIILFNVPSNNPERPTYTIPNKSRVRWYNSQRYGAVKIAVRTKKVRQANVYFSLLFGGGATYNAGEDSLFLAECLRKGMKVYASPKIIGFVDQETSSWYEGYNEKFFYDKGVYFSHLSKRFSSILCLQFILRHKKMFKNEIGIFKAYKIMLEGTKEIKNG